MGLAFEAIYPEVYPVAYELFTKGMERYRVAGYIYTQFGKKYNVTERETDAAMIDLSITCAENDFNKKLDKGTSGRMEEDRWLSHLIGGKLEKNKNNEKEVVKNEGEKKEELDKINVEQKNGNELFTFNEKSINCKLIDFWRWSVSDLLSNATRGTLAEFIVATAMEIDLSSVREEWKAYDLETKNGIKIEVKTSAYLQSWFQNNYSKIIFSIKSAYSWNSKTNELSKIKSRPADVYVFCLLKHKDKSTVNPLILEQWIFYVISTKKINKMFGDKNTIQLKSLENVVEGVNYNEIKKNVMKEYSEK